MSHRRKTHSALTLLASTGIALVATGAPGTASAAGPTLSLKVSQPNVLLVLDTSASMSNGFDANGNSVPGDCDAGTDSRWFMVASALTGTLQDPWCKSGAAGGFNGDDIVFDDKSIPFGEVDKQSNGNTKVCVFAPSRTAATWDAINNTPGSWPLASGKQPMIIRRVDKAEQNNTGFNNGNGNNCNFVQLADGVLDTYQDRLRFGLATSDGLTFYHRTNAFAVSSSNGPDVHSRTITSTNSYIPTNQRDDWMPWTQESDDVPWQWSYWYRSQSRNSVVESVSNRVGYDIIGLGLLFSNPTYPYSAYGLTPSSFKVGGGLFPESCPGLTAGLLQTSFREPNGLLNLGQPLQGCWDSYDIGIRNSYAAPWMGRLIGFGRSAANSTELISHNQMVDSAIMSYGPYVRHSTPLTAMMRDTAEFMRNDILSKGAQFPDHNPTASDAYVGPERDPFVQSDCRDQAVVVITDGRRSFDVADDPSASQYGPAYYAENLYNQLNGAGGGPTHAKRVTTYVVGVTPDYFDIGGSRYWCSAKPGAAAGTQLTLGNYTSTCVYNPSTQAFNNAASATPAGALTSCCSAFAIADKGSGGLESPRFGNSTGKVKAALLDVFRDVAGETISRTVPQYGKSVSANTAADHDAAYEILSAMETFQNGSTWKGLLHRQRDVCVSGALTTQPIADNATNTNGDKFELSLANTGVKKRKMWTVLPKNENKVETTRRSIRPVSNPAQDDNVDAYDAVVTDLVEPKDLGAEIASKTGGTDASELMGITGGSASSTCIQQFNISGTPGAVRIACGKNVLGWLGGAPVPLGGGTSGTVQTRTDPLGAIWRSNPVLVPPPQPVIADETYSDVDDPNSFVGTHGLRPTMTYVQTIDGLLHAFVVQRNDPTASGAHYGEPRVPSATDGNNNELWSFIPPAILGSLWSNAGTHARLLDGTITVRDVVFSRSESDRQSGAAAWKTVLVASSGFSSVGTGFYYAIDITDPTEPKFLWQLSKTKNDSALFGETTSGPAITTIKLPGPGATVKYVAVALLPGGQPASAQPTKTVNRNFTSYTSAWTNPGSGPNFTPRSQIRDWDKDQPSRTITVVELKTGNVLAVLSGDDSDFYSGIPGSKKAKPNSLPNKTTRFDSPMSGSIVPYPDFPGEPSSRAYVGDIDGTMWRIDLTSLDPEKYTSTILWDAYSANALTDSYVRRSPPSGTKLNVTSPTPGLVGQPIQLDPLVSVDADGVPIVMFATGDQETFTQPVSTMINFMVSVRDNSTQASVSKTTLMSEIAFTNGERTVGPLTLFDGRVYASYFEPNTGAAACTIGSSGYCAFDYIDSAREGAGTAGDGDPDPVEDWDGSGALNSVDICYNPPATSEILFGMSLFQKPTCESADVTNTDAFFGGSYTTHTTTNSPTYQLVSHTNDSSAPEQDAKISTSHKGVKTPTTTTRVVSWTNVIE